MKSIESSLNKKRLFWKNFQEGLSNGPTKILQHPATAEGATAALHEDIRIRTTAADETKESRFETRASGGGGGGGGGSSTANNGNLRSRRRLPFFYHLCFFVFDE